ncbi:MAG TPA: hypothetical protein VF159_06315 [Gemmatimonadaceae bacterium]
MSATTQRLIVDGVIACAAVYLLLRARRSIMTRRKHEGCDKCGS